MVDRLEAGRHLAMLGDQDAGSHGLFVDFFGQPASTFKSIALLALRYQALICVGYAIRLESDDGPERFEVGCEELIDTATFDGSDPVTELTQAYTAALERIVRRAPGQYFWLHRRWKSKPDPQGRRSKRARSGRLPWAA
jgi:KDO2-lipid IV(A) lauroyltransferase